MGNSADKNNIFLKTIKKITQASTYFYNCLNSEKSIDANIAYHFNFETTYLKYLNTLYSDYIKFYYYYSNLETELENIEVLKRNNEILTSYINDISLTTSYLKHGENDVSYTLNLLNQYSDTSFEGSKQIKCIFPCFSTILILYLLLVMRQLLDIVTVFFYHYYYYR